MDKSLEKLQHDLPDGKGFEPGDEPYMIKGRIFFAPSWYIEEAPSDEMQVKYPASTEVSE